MNNRTIKKMKTYNIKIDEIQREEVIRLGKQIIMKNQLHRYSLFDLFCSSIRFTRFHTWLIQFILLILTTFLITRVINDEQITFIIQCLTVVVIISIGFFMEELFRSFKYGMWELEQTLKYDIRQQTIMKLLIFGVIDLLLIICLAFISQGVITISFWNIILYLLVPFNITCIILFSLFTAWRNTLSSVVIWIGAGIILMVIVVISNLFNVYEIGMVYWGLGYILSFIILGFVATNMLKTNKWEAFC